MDPVASYGRFWPKKCIEQTEATGTQRCELLLRGKVRRSTIAVVGVLALLGGIAMAMTNTPGSSIGFGVGGLFLMTLFR